MLAADRRFSTRCEDDERLEMGIVGRWTTILGGAAFPDVEDDRCDGSTICGRLLFVPERSTPRLLPMRKPPDVLNPFVNLLPRAPNLRELGAGSSPTSLVSPPGDRAGSDSASLSKSAQKPRGTQKGCRRGFGPPTEGPWWFSWALSWRRWVLRVLRVLDVRPRRGEMKLSE
jgi:hypothetical protein